MLKRKIILEIHNSLEKNIITKQNNKHTFLKNPRIKIKIHRSTGLKIKNDKQK